jgi:hypothetical protein
MQVEWGEIGDLERALGAYLAQKLDVLKAQMRDRKFSRYAKTAGAAVVGGTLMALTAASAAPVIGIIAGSGIWGASTVAGLLSLGTLHAIFGVAGAGLVGHKMRRRTKGLQEFDFVEGGGQNGHGMALTICIRYIIIDIIIICSRFIVIITIIIICIRYIIFTICIRYIIFTICIRYIIIIIICIRYIIIIIRIR